MKMQLLLAALLPASGDLAARPQQTTAELSYPELGYPWRWVASGFGAQCTALQPRRMRVRRERWR